MKVIQINTECEKGSTGKIVKSISDLLLSNNIENYIFYSGNHSSACPLGIQINSKFQIKIHQLLSRILGDQGCHSIYSTLKLIRRLKIIKPDYIHLHNIHGYYINFPLLFRYLSKTKIKVIWTLHDCWAFTGHCTHFLTSDCYKWERQCYKCPSLKKYPYSWFFDRSKMLYNKKKKLFTQIEDMTIVTPSKWLANYVKKSYLGKYDVKVIHNGININVFRYRESKFRVELNCEKKFVILGVSSVWNCSKGLDVFCELANKLDDSYQIILVGTNAEIDKYLPSNIVSIHNTQNQIQLAKLYSMADLFLNPTIEDTYPTVNIEALACGTPVLTFNTGGSPESSGNIDDFIVKSNTVEETIMKIKDISSGKIKFPEGKIDISKLDENKCFEKYLKLYGIK